MKKENWIFFSIFSHILAFDEFLRLHIVSSILHIEMVKNEGKHSEVCSQKMIKNWLGKCNFHFFS